MSFTTQSPSWSQPRKHSARLLLRRAVGLVGAVRHPARLRWSQARNCRRASWPVHQRTNVFPGQAHSAPCPVVHGIERTRNDAERGRAHTIRGVIVPLPNRDRIVIGLIARLTTITSTNRSRSPQYQQRNPRAQRRAVWRDRKRASMSEISMASVRVPNDLIERAIENSGMRGCTLTNLVRAGVAALAILPSEQALRIADQALKDYGSVPGRQRHSEPKSDSRSR